MLCVWHVRRSSSKELSVVLQEMTHLEGFFSVVQDSVQQAFAFLYQLTPLFATKRPWCGLSQRLGTEESRKAFKHAHVL